MENFITCSLQNFNETYGVDILPTDTFDEAMLKIEGDGTYGGSVDYYYASLNKEDVTQAVKELYDDIGRVIDNLIFIDTIGIYIALF